MKIKELPDLSFFSIILLGDTHGFIDDFEMQKKIIEDFDPDYVLYEFLEDNALVTSEDFDDFLKKDKVSDMTEMDEVKDLLLLCKKKEIPVIGIDLKNFGIENPVKFKEKLENNVPFSKKEIVKMDNLGLFRENYQFEMIKKYENKGKILVITGSYHLRDESPLSYGFKDSLVVYPESEGKMLVEPVKEIDQVRFNFRKSSKIKLRESLYILDDGDCYKC